MQYLVRQLAEGLEYSLILMRERKLNVNIILHYLIRFLNGKLLGGLYIHI